MTYAYTNLLTKYPLLFILLTHLLLCGALGLLIFKAEQNPDEIWIDENSEIKKQ
jgi:hypothetical protein